MGLQPLKPCHTTLTTNGWTRRSACHSRVYAVSCRAKPDKAGGWGCNPHTQNTRCILFYTRAVMYCDIYCPCSYSHTENTQCVLFYTGPYLLRNKTKQNETKENHDKRKPRGGETKTGFFGVVFSLHGLAAPETLPHNAYGEWKVQALCSFPCLPSCNA